MSLEMSYVLITPYTLMKSRTGGVLARLLSRCEGLELEGAQMLAPTKEFADSYAESLWDTVGARHAKAGRLLSDYVRERFSPAVDGRRQRVLALVFKGENACDILYRMVGQLTPDPVDSSAITGETIRDTYADLVFYPDGRLRYFEPAVLTPPNQECALKKLPLIADFAASQPNLATNIIRRTELGERTLVIIKPDNWARASSKPGNIIDMFSRTGLRIVGCKIHRMPVADALEFYGVVREALRAKLGPKLGVAAIKLVEKEYGIRLCENSAAELTKVVGDTYADDQFERIIEFMAGRRPSACQADELKAPGLVKCMAMVYEGPNAVNSIRNVLGPTDPLQAPGGTIRGDFGKDVMVNTAHASDSTAAAEREMAVVRMGENRLASIIHEFVSGRK